MFIITSKEMEKQDILCLVFPSLSKLWSSTMCSLWGDIEIRCNFLFRKGRDAPPLGPFFHVHAILGKNSPKFSLPSGKSWIRHWLPSHPLLRVHLRDRRNEENDVWSHHVCSLHSLIEYSSFQSWRRYSWHAWICSPTSYGKTKYDLSYLEESASRSSTWSQYPWSHR